MMHEIIEPFVILPYGNMQDIIFFFEESLRNEYSLLIDLAYKKLSNDTLQDNLIKVVSNMHEMIIFHIYPTYYKEKYSNRMGQNLIIGYIIKKRYFHKRFESIVYGCNLFFEAIKHCGYLENDSLSIPTKFLYKVNEEHYNEYINSYLKAKRAEIQILIKKNILPQKISPDNRLGNVYSFIKSKYIICGEYWILIDIENIDYYKKLNRSYKIILKNKWDV